LLLGCSTPAPRPPPQRARPDKAALYGDSALVPTRRGEHARAELALSGELEALLRVVPGIVSVRAEVGLDPAMDLERALVLVRHARPPSDEDPLRTEVEAIVESVLPRGPRTVRLYAAAADPHDPHERPPWAVAMVFLGLGLSLGIAVERVRRARA